MVRSGPGERFVRAIATRDAETLHALLRPDVDFRAMTPARFWVAMSAAKVVDQILLGNWFSVDDAVTEIEFLESGPVGDRQRVSYRFHVENPTGRFAVEQHAFFDVQRGQISWLRMMSSGFRRLRDVPVPAGSAKRRRVAG